MLQLFNSAVGSFLALTTLLILLFGPIVAVWGMFSIRRSLARIAESLEGARLANYTTPLPRPNEVEAPLVSRERNIANSIFGR